MYCTWQILYCFSTYALHQSQDQEEPPTAPILSRAVFSSTAHCSIQMSSGWGSPYGTLNLWLQGDPAAPRRKKPQAQAMHYSVHNQILATHGGSWNERPIHFPPSIQVAFAGSNSLQSIEVPSIFQDFKDFIHVSSMHAVLHGNERDFLLGDSSITQSPLGISDEKLFFNKTW